MLQKLFLIGYAIAAVVLTNSVIGYTTESQSEKIIHSLQSEDKPSALVVRDGERQEIDGTEIVPGDILLLQTNNYVAADAHIGQGVIQLESDRDESVGAIRESPLPTKLLQIVVLCNESEIIQGEDGDEVKGSATENALIYMAMAAEIDIPKLRAKHTLILNPISKRYFRFKARN